MSRYRRLSLCFFGALLLATCGPDLDRPDLESFEARKRLDGLPPGARQRVSQIHQELARTPKRKDLWRDLAMTLHANGLPELAAATYGTALQLEPADAKMMYLRCHALREAREPEQATEELALGLDAGVAYAPASRTLAVWSLEAGDLERARQAATEARRMAPDEPGVRAALGKIELAEGDYTAALEVLAGGEASTSGRAYLDFLAARARQAATGERITAGSILEPRWSDPWLEELANYRRGIEEDLEEALAAIERDEPDAAIEILEPALRWRPDQPAAIQMLALAYRRVGAFDKALQLLRNAVQIQPRSAEHLIHLAATCLVTAAETDQSELLAEALHAARRLQETWPQDYRGHAVAGDVLNATGERQEALEAYLVCGALARRSSARCEIKAARILLAQGRGRAAAGMLSDVFGREPDDSEAATLLAAARQSSAAAQG